MLLPLNNLTPIQLKVLSTYPTYQKFMMDYKPVQLLVQYDDVNSIEQSLSTECIQIGDLCLIYSNDKTNASFDYIKEWLSALNRTLNINKPLVDLDSIAYMIYKDYKYLYLTDFKIIFERLARGDYGMFYGSVDAQVILRAFVKYKTEWKLLKNKANPENKTDQKIKKTELEIYLEKAEKAIRQDVLSIQEQDKELTGYKRIIKSELMIGERLHKAKEEFLKNRVDMS